MDTTSLYYFRELARELHMTNTAARLFISQQTLSNHIKRLEEELGTELFYRKPALSLTPAGERVLEFTMEILKEQQNLNDSLSDYVSENKGIIRFGASTLRMNCVFPHIAGRFSDQYPNVSFRLTEKLSDDLLTMIGNGDLDFALVRSNVENAAITEEVLCDDSVYLCVSNDLLNYYYGEETTAIKVKALRGVDLKNFEKLPFCILENQLGKQISEQAKAANVRLQTYLTSIHTQISTSVGQEGRAACFVTQMELASMPNLPEDWNIFPMMNGVEPMTQKISLAYQKDRYITKYAAYFMKILQEYFENVEATHMSRFVRY